MSGYALSSRSRARLDGVHPDLVAVIERAITLTPVDFGVSQGLRTLEEQRRLVRSGASETLKSRHLTGHAVDVYAWVDGAASWRFGDYRIIARAMKQAAAERSVPIIWGGDWTRLRDGPHFELNRQAYPADDPSVLEAIQPLKRSQAAGSAR